jgi:polysaccharide export outer membrane protein
VAKHLAKGARLMDRKNRQSTFLLVGAFLLGAFTLAGCGAKSSDTAAQSSSQTIAPATAVGGTQNNETTTSAIASVERSAPDYGIGPGDVLQIAVFDVPNLSTSAQVGTDGAILFPLIGAVRVAGMTTSQAAHVLADKLGEKYLQSPQVSVLVARSAQRVSVNGAVEKPGVITLDGTLTLTQAVAEAGGTNNVADENRVHIARVRPDQTVKDSVFDLEAIKGGTARDPRLQSGDIVVVETSGTRQAFQTVLQIMPLIGTIGTLAVIGGL